MYIYMLFSRARRVAHIQVGAYGARSIAANRGRQKRALSERSMHITHNTNTQVRSLTYALAWLTQSIYRRHLNRQQSVVIAIFSRCVFSVALSIESTRFSLSFSGSHTLSPFVFPHLSVIIIHFFLSRGFFSSRFPSCTILK